jgi:glycosyltransferase involved in cell wall biosynthesis
LIFAYQSKYSYFCCKDRFMPKLSVLMPNYNASEFIQEALESVLNQTFQDLEIILVDDCSTDNSLEIVRALNSPKIKIYSTKVNGGIVAALNEGLKHINSEYIVRMDSDDISTSDRFETLVRFMDNNPDIGVCGSYMETFGKHNWVWRYKLTDEDIRPCLLYKSLIPHPASIFRSSILKHISYSSKYPHIEDRELWWQLFDKTKFANIPKVLYKYRIGIHNVTQVNKGTQAARRLEFYGDLYQYLGLSFSKLEIELFLGHNEKLYSDFKNFKHLKRLHEKILDFNDKSKIFCRKSLKRHLNQRFSNVSTEVAKLGFLAYFRYLFLSSFRYIKLIDLKVLYLGLSNK